MERLIATGLFVSYLIVGFLDVLSNAVLIHALRKLKKLQTLSYYFILLQSISHICAGLTLIFTGISLKLIYKPGHYAIAEEYMGILCVFFCQFSMTMVLIIAVDRYIHMTQPLKYTALMTRFRAKLVVVVNIAFWLCVAIFHVLLLNHEFQIILSAAISMLVVVTFLIASVLYWKAYQTIRQQTKGLEKAAENGERDPGSTMRRNASREFAKAVLCILFGALLCYFPIVLVTLITAHNTSSKSNSHTVPEIAADASMFLFCIFPTANAAIFIFFNRQLKTFVLSCGVTTADEQSSTKKQETSFIT